MTASRLHRTTAACAAALLCLAHLLASCAAPVENPPQALGAAQAPSIQPSSTATLAPAPTSTLPEPTATAAPTASPAVQPSPTPSFVMVRFDLPPEVFSPRTASATTPEDVVNEMTFSVGGEAGTGKGCESFPESAGPIRIRGTESAEWQQPVKVETCGWSQGEEVIFTLLGPDGAPAAQETFKAYQAGIVTYLTLIPINTPPGIYTARFEGKTGRAEMPVTYQVPAGPRAWGGFGDQTQLVLYNFKPNERVRLFLYQGGPQNDSYLGENRYRFGTLVAWQDYRARAGGELVIEVDKAFLTGGIAVVGDETGIVYGGSYYSSPFTADNVMQYDLTVSHPREGMLEQASSIFDRVAFQELPAPGERTYAVKVKPGDRYHWQFLWCATGAAAGKHMMESITPSLSINGTRVAEAQLALLDYERSDGWRCVEWVTMLSGWKQGADYRLVVEYTFDQPVFDGVSRYGAGIYRQVIDVTVE